MLRRIGRGARATARLTSRPEASALGYAPHAPGMIADPYPVYAQLVAAGPVRDPTGVWLVARYGQVSELVKDPRLSAQRPAPATVGQAPIVRQAVAELWSTLFHRWTLWMDPPEHTRVRAAIRTGFAPRVVAELRPRIQEAVDGLLDAVAPRGAMDVIADLAAPLPTRIVAELIGLPVEDAPMFKQRTEDIVASLGAEVGPPEMVPLFVRAAQSLRHMYAYLGDYIDRRRLRPSDDLLGALLAAEDAGALSPEEVGASCLLLLGAGNETTTHLIGNGTLALLRHPGEIRRLRDDPSLLPTAIDELLRYDPPVQMTERIALAPVEIGDVTVTPGEWVRLLFAAACRDPAVFPDPDRLDVGRRDGRSLAFGGGVHYCLGSALGKLEAEIAIGTVLRRFPNVALAAEPIRRPNPAFRGLVSLPLVLA